MGRLSHSQVLYQHVAWCTSGGGEVGGSGQLLIVLMQRSRHRTPPELSTLLCFFHCLSTLQPGTTLSTIKHLLGLFGGINDAFRTPPLSCRDKQGCCSGNGKEVLFVEFLKYATAS